MINSLYDVYFGKNDSEDSFAHVGRSKRDGAKVGSGRYPLGSGKEPYQHVNKSKSSLIDKIFGKKKSYEFDYSYTLNTKENPDDYKLLRPMTRNAYETLKSEYGFVSDMTSGKAGYKTLRGGKDVVNTYMKTNKGEYDEDDIIKSIEDNGFDVYQTYDKNFKLKSIEARGPKEKPIFEDDQYIFINVGPDTTFTEKKVDSYDGGTAITKNGDTNINLKKYLPDSDMKMYKQISNKNPMFLVKFDTEDYCPDRFGRRMVFCINPKKDQEKQIKELNDIIDKNGYTGYDRAGNIKKLEYNKDLVDGLDYETFISKDKKDFIHIICPSIEGYAKEEGTYHEEVADILSEGMPDDQEYFVWDNYL